MSEFKNQHLLGTVNLNVQCLPLIKLANIIILGFLWTFSDVITSGP